MKYHITFFSVDDDAIKFELNKLVNLYKIETN